MPTNGRLRFALYLIVGKDSLVKWKPWKYSKHFQMLFWKPEVKQLFHQIKIGFWTWILRVAARRAQLRGPTNKTLLSWFANTRKPSLMHFACPNLFMVIIIKTYFASIQVFPLKLLSIIEQCCGAEPFLLGSGSSYFFFRLRLQVTNFGSGSTYKSSAPTGSGFKKQILIQNIWKT